MKTKTPVQAIKKLALALAAAVLLPASATTYYWIGGASGDWSNGANWSLSEGGASAGAYPNSGDDTAFFPSGASLTLNSYAKVRKIFTDGTLTLAGNGNGGIQTTANNNTAPLTIGGERRTFSVLPRGRAAILRFMCLERFRGLER